MKYRLPFDDFAKERLEDLSPAVPDHIWENIRKKKDNKRPFFLFYRNQILWVLALLSGIGIIAYFSNANLNTNTKNNFSEKIDHQIRTENSNESKLINHSTLIAQQKETFNTNATVSKEIIIESENAHSAQSNAVAPANNSDLSISKLKNESSALTISKSNITNHQPQTTLVTSPENSKHDNHSLIPSAKWSTDKEIVSEENYTSSAHGTSIYDYADENISAKNVSNLGFENEQQSLTRTPQSMELFSIKNQFTHEIKKPVINQLNIPCPVAKSKSPVNKSYLEGYGAVDYVLRQFNDTPNSTYLISRKESTSFASAYSAGIRFTKVFDNGINFRVGLNYSQINEKFKYVQGNIVQVVFIMNAAGDTIGSYQTTSTRYKTSYNHYKTLDIPVTLGYEFEQGKWNINLNTGFIVNIHSWNQGEVLNKSLEPVAISGDSYSPYQFKTNIGVGGIGAASFYYTLNKKWCLMGEPYLRYNFSTMNKTDITLKQKYHTSGIKIGLRLNL